MTTMRGSLDRFPSFSLSLPSLSPSLLSCSARLFNCGAGFFSLLFKLNQGIRLADGETKTGSEKEKKRSGGHGDRARWARPA
jgi:hypothetical protein